MQEQLTNIALDPVAGAMVVGIVVIVFAIVVLIVILRRGSGQQALLARLADNQVRIEGAFSSLLETAQTGNSDLKRNLEERLDLFGKRMGDNLSQNREQTHDNLKSLGERLAVIDRAQKNIETLY